MKQFMIFFLLSVLSFSFLSFSFAGVIPADEDFSVWREPQWLGQVQCFLGAGYEEYVGGRNTGSGMYGFAEADWRPLSLYHQDADDVIRKDGSAVLVPRIDWNLGLHLGADYATGKIRNDYSWDVISWEAGLSSSYQNTAWQAQFLLRVSFRHLYQTGESEVNSYKNNGQNNYQIETQLVAEKWLAWGNWFNYFQVIATVQSDLSSNKDSEFAGQKISAHDDPASEQSVYGLEIVANVWDNRIFWLVPRIGAGYYYNMWNYHSAVPMFGGVRICGGWYLDGGYKANFGGQKRQLDAVFARVGLDPVGFYRWMKNN